MSYNGFTSSNAYSPYFQHTSGQAGRTQNQDQSRNAGYQNASYLPISTYQQRAQAFGPQGASNSSHEIQGYGNLNAPGMRLQDSRSIHASSERPVDTSALGNLAYASSLGRGDPSPQQIPNYNHTQSTASHGNDISYGAKHTSSFDYGAEHGRTDSRGLSREDTSARLQQVSQGTSLNSNPSNGRSGYQGHQNDAESYAQRHTQHTTPQATRPSDLSYHTGQPPHPSSGHPVQHLPSRKGSQASQLPKDQVHQAAVGQVKGESGIIQGSRPSRVQSPLQQVQPNSSAPNSYGNGSFAQEVPAPKHMQASAGAADRNQTRSQPSLSHSAPERIFRNSPAVDNHVNGANSPTTTPAENSFPPTVDPSQVFNQYEYSRKQAEAEAIRRKTAEAAQKVVEAAQTVAQPKSALQDVSAAPSSNDIDLETAKKNQMELEMKQMIEKMRDYKSKDPSLFSQIWEQVKKGQPVQRTPSQASPQDSSASPRIVNDQPPDHVISQAQLPPESDLPAARLPEADRGRFPAQRRRRDRKKDTPSKDTPSKEVHAPGNSPSTSATTLTPTAHVQNLGKAVPSSVPGFQSTTMATQDLHKISSPLLPQISLAVTSAPVQAARPNPSPSIPTSTLDTQHPTPPSKPGGTWWPENKKRALAEAARHALTTAKTNMGKPITTDEIHALLDQNPSYSQMCEILEYRGFVIDRGQLARLLLSAVPDLEATDNSNIATKQLPKVSLPSSDSRPPMLPREGIYRPRPLDNAYTTPFARPNVGPHTHGGLQSAPTPQEEASRPKPILRGGNLIGAADTKSYANSADRDNLTKPPHSGDDHGKVERQGRHPQSNYLHIPRGNVSRPSTKQDLARKRNFGDIVDLTQLSEDERPPQRPRLNAANVPDPATVSQYSPGHTSSVRAAPIPTGKFASQHGTSSDPATATVSKSTASGREHLLKEKVVNPFRREDALRRSSYEPSTIARDVLVSLGKHPTMRPLNAHLEVLRTRFHSVNYDSDLHTFRWDLVDPGGDPVPAINDANNKDTVGLSDRAPIDHQHSRISVVIDKGPFTGGGLPTPLGKDNTSSGGDNSLNRSKATALGSHAAKASPSRRGRGRPSQGGHMDSIVGSRTDDTQSTSQSQTSGQVQSGFANQQQNPRHEPRTPTHKIPGQGSAPDNTVNPNLSHFAYNPPSSTSMHNATVSVLGSEKKKGRPPGAKNKHPRPDKGMQKKRLTDRSGLENVTTPTDGIAVVIPSPASSVANTPDGKFAKVRLMKMPTPGGRHPPQPSYQIYRCHWENCPAQLHNFETLKKHVRKHRGSPEEAPFPCSWANCYDNNVSATNRVQEVSDSKHERERERHRLSFESGEAWEKHVVENHIDAVPYDLGNGPANHSPDYVSSDYGNESWSRQPTPRTQNGPRGLPNLSSTSMPSPLKSSRGNENRDADYTELERARASIEAHGTSFRTNLFS